MNGLVEQSLLRVSAKPHEPGHESATYLMPDGKYI